MKASEMTNEELAKALMRRVPLDSNNHDDIREASARLRKQDIIVAAQKAKGAAAKREREATREKSSQVGNAAKMRSAIVRCVNLITEFGDAEIIKMPLDVLIDIEAILNVALSAPPRNCDVGTADEQGVRFTKFCGSQDCKRTCPFSDDYDSYRCEFAWAQMPYEEGGAK